MGVVHSDDVAVEDRAMIVGIEVGDSSMMGMVCSMLVLRSCIKWKWELRWVLWVGVWVREKSCMC